jgi:hypothetical protein
MKVRYFNMYFESKIINFFPAVGNPGDLFANWRVEELKSSFS